MGIKNPRFILPKKTLYGFAVFVLAIILITSGILYRKSREDRLAKPPIPSELRKLAGNEKDLKKLMQDSDKDGLLDWEEFVYKTDRQNPDTDGDETPDGKEVKEESRDPLKPGPHDQLEIAPLAGPDLEENKQNLTAEFARNFLAKPAAQIIAGQKPLLDVSGAAAFAEILTNRGVLFLEEPQFSSEDLKKISDNSPLALKKYIDAVNDAWNKHFGLVDRPGFELFVAILALEKEEYRDLKNLEIFIEKYAGVIDELRNIAAPPDAQNFHLALLNSFHRIQRGIKIIIETAERDPMTAIVVIQESDQINSMLNQLIADFMESSAPKLSNL